LLDCFQYPLEDTGRIAKDIVVPEAQDAESAHFQIGIANLIADTLSMLAPVCFDDQPMLERDEIDDPRSERDLTPEFVVGQLPRAEKMPELLLGIRRGASQIARLSPL
jgi:hypothetical protein